MRNRSDLRPSQLKIIEEIKSSCGLQIVLGMGGGKSISALTAIRDLIDEGTIRCAIVLAPMRVALTTWPDEVQKWSHLSDMDLVVLKGAPARRKKLLCEDHEVYVCSIDNIVWLIDELRKLDKGDKRWDFLAIDEMSRFKSPRGTRSKKLARFADRFKAIIGLTGTPRPNGWEDQYMPLQIVSAGIAWNTSGFDAWRKEHCRQMDYQGFKWEVRDDALPYIKSVIDEWTLTIPPDQATDIPFNSGPDFDVIVPLTQAQKDDLESLERELVIELGGEGVDLLDDSEDIVAAMSQATASGKMAQVMQGFLYKDGETVQTYGKAKLNALDDLLAAADGENVVIVYHFKHDLELLRGHLKGAEVLGSETSDTESVRIIDAWNRGEIQYLLCHPASVGHGIQLQFGGRRMIWYTMTWSQELWVQMCKRIARPGQTEPVYVHRLLADHWYEAKRVRRVEEKMAGEAEFIQSLRRI